MPLCRARLKLLLQMQEEDVVARGWKPTCCIKSVEEELALYPDLCTLAASLPHVSQPPGTPFTCFASSKVQILTPEELLRALAASLHVSSLQQRAPQAEERDVKRSSSGVKKRTSNASKLSPSKASKLLY